jgi:predicted RNA binding protein YcfA (HicA-like mRNA interferase family)
MPKAARVPAALKRDGWVEIYRKGSHRRLEKRDVRRTWAFHDAFNLGKVQMRRSRERSGISWTT